MLDLLRSKVCRIIECWLSSCWNIFSNAPDTIPTDACSIERDRSILHLFPTNRKSAAALLGFVLLCLAVGGFGSWLTTPNLDPWYADLAKPPFNPPNWIFGPVWTTLFLFMAYAIWRIWQVPSSDVEIRRKRGQAMFAFGLHLILNIGWSAAFFFAQSLAFGLAIISLLALSIATVMVLFFKLDRVAGLLFVPYLLWVLFASVLNLSIFLLN